ncbi:MAG: hypothetical protein KIG65_08200 [Eubacteriales bacterium]|nr:hypothetical protein [Eubacteriales bacterium]
MDRNKKLIEYIKNNYDECLDSGKRVREHLLQSPVAFHGRCVQTLHIPKIYKSEDIGVFRNLVSDFYAIFDKIVKHYIASPEYRKLFPFSKELEELILVDAGYGTAVPVMRMDIFYNEETKDFKFCELNTDGTSAMVEDYELFKAFEINNLPRELIGDVSCFELFDSWVLATGSIYRNFKNRVKNPRVAIVDFLDKAYLPEFYEFKRRFEKYGYPTKVVDIRKLKFENGVLLDENGDRVDIIYRRAVTVDIMNELHECGAFIDAYKAGAVCVLGALRTQIIHHKALFYILRDKKTREILTDRENELIEKHIPYTSKLVCADIDRIIADKDRYIIKPSDSYASKGVFAGVDATLSEWKELVEKYRNEDYIVQEYCTPYKTENIYLADKQPQFKMYSNLTGLYVYDGMFAGVYSRLSDGGIISSQYNEKSVVTFVEG